MNPKPRRASFMITPLYLLSSLLLSSCFAIPLGSSGGEVGESSQLAFGAKRTAEIDRLVADSLWEDGAVWRC